MVMNLVMEAKAKKTDTVDLDALEEELEGKYAELPPIPTLPKDFLKLFAAKNLDWVFKVYEGKEDADSPGDMIFKAYDRELPKFKAAGWKKYWEDYNGDEDAKIIIFNKPGTGKVKKTP
jgi:hypothetical protein